jgi:hypothetical protein
MILTRSMPKTTEYKYYGFIDEIIQAPDLTIRKSRPGIPLWPENHPFSRIGPDFWNQPVRHPTNI